MFRIPTFLKPKRNLVNILRANTGNYRHSTINKLLKSIDVYNEPLQIVFMLATAIYKLNKKQLTPQLIGVINHERFGNAINMATFYKICKIFNDNNIPIMAQKGLVQKLLYPQTTRPMNDVDFSVPKHLYRQAIDIAIKNGFHINYDMIGSADLQFQNQGCIDIHYSIFKGSNPVMDTEIFNRAHPIDINGCHILLPCPEDIIVIILCEFYGNFLYESGSSKTNIKQIFASHPQWVLDCYKIICDNPNLNWGQIMRTAQLSKYDYQIKILITILNKILPNSVSNHALNIINSMCPDYKIKHFLKRDIKIMTLHYKNYQFLHKNDML